MASILRGEHTIQRSAWERTRSKSAYIRLEKETSSPYPFFHITLYIVRIPIVLDSLEKKRKKKKTHATELELSLKREIFCLARKRSLAIFVFLSLFPCDGARFARPRDTYGGVIKIHVAFGYTEPAILTPHRLGAYFAARRVACVAE